MKQDKTRYYMLPMIVDGKTYTALFSKIDGFYLKACSNEYIASYWEPVTLTNNELSQLVPVIGDVQYYFSKVAS